MCDVTDFVQMGHIVFNCNIINLKNGTCMYDRQGLVSKLESRPRK